MRPWTRCFSSARPASSIVKLGLHLACREYKPQNRQGLSVGSPHFQAGTYQGTRTGRGHRPCGDNSLRWVPSTGSRLLATAVFRMVSKAGTRPPHSTAHQGMSKTSTKVSNGFPGLRTSDITIYSVSALHFLPRLELMIASILSSSGTG